MTRLWGGVNVTSPINGDFAGTQSAPRIVVLDATRYLVIWSSDAVPGGVSDPEVRGRIFSTSGTPLGTEFGINTTTAGAQFGGVAARLAGGGFVVAWQDNDAAADGSGSAIRYQRFDDDGVKIGPESVANVTTASNQTRPSVAGLSDGGFVITWSDASQSGGDTSGLAVRGMQFSASGATIGSEFLVNTATNRSQTASQVVALQNGGFAVVWQDESPQGVTVPGQSRQDQGSDIVIRVYNAAGVPLSAQRTVDDRTFSLFVNGSDNGNITARNPAAAVLSDGRIAVTWIDNGFTFARVLNADGTAAGGVLAVDSNRSAFPLFEAQNLGSAPVTTTTAITALANGGFVVGWAEARQVSPEELTQAVWARAFDATGTAEGRTFRLNTGAAGDQIAPALAAFANGNFLAAWQDGSTTDIGAQLFATTTGSITDIAFTGSIDRLGIGNLPIGLLSGTGAVNAQYTFSLLNDPSGVFSISGDRLIVTDPENLWNYSGNAIALQVRATDQLGNSYTETLNAPIAGVPYGRTLVAGPEIIAAEQTAVGNSASPLDLLALPGNRQLLLSQEFRTASNSFDVVARFIEADGTIGTPFVVNTVTTGNQLGGSATMVGTDRILIAWNTPTTTNDILAQLFDISGTRIGGTFSVNSTTAGSQSTPVLVGLPGGTFFIAWQDSNAASDGSSTSVRGQFFDASGGKVGSELVVNTTTLNAQNGPAASLLASGQIVVTWTDASASGGDTSSTAIRGQLLNTDGTRFGSEFLVNTTTAGVQSQSAVVALAGGGFAVVWRDASGLGTTNDYDVRGQVFDATGNRVGGEFVVNSQRIGMQSFQREPSIAADAYGGFVVSWSDFSGYGTNDGDGSSIKAQRFTADGTPIGGEFLVNVTSPGQQNIGIVRVLSDGDLAFAWWDLSLVTDTQDPARILLRTFDATSGNRIAGATNGADTLTGTVGADILAGLDGNDVLNGDRGNDDLTGGAGNDRLDGGVGADRMSGGTQDDSYVVDNIGDVVNELADAGNDTVEASITYSIASLANVENITLTGTASLDATGNAANNRLIGNSGTNRLYGGLGDDTYVVDQQGDLVFENAGEGTDTVISTSNFYLYANIENLTLAAGAGNIFGVGNELANTILGNEGANTLLGGGGVDTIRAGAGVDIVYGEAGNDQVFGDAGNDFLAGGIGDDALDGGEGGDSLYGEDGNDTLTGGSDFVFDQLVGGAGDDILRGDSGQGDYDYLYGNAGNDTFYVDTPADLVFEQAGEGTDTVYASINGGGYYLYDNIENLVLLGNTPFGVGNTLNNRLTGNGQGNYLLGGAGNDTLNGKAGNDVLFGEAGADTFVFERGTGGDVIGDFVAGTDRIDLSAFGFASFAALQAAIGQNGSDSFISLGNGDLVVLNGVAQSSLQAGDFILSAPQSAIASDPAIDRLQAAEPDSEAVGQPVWTMPHNDRPLVRFGAIDRDFDVAFGAGGPLLMHIDNPYL